MDKRTVHISPGWTVVGSDGDKIGEVKATHEDYILVSHGTLIKHDLYVPIDHVASLVDGKVTIAIKGDEVDAEGWRYPPNAGFEHEKPAYPDVPETTTIEAAGYSAGRLSAPEPQGAVLDDGMIDTDEVPNEDLTANETPDALDDEDDG